jgi:hypothetical protein
LSFSSWIKMMKRDFFTCHDAVKKLTSFKSILFRQLQGNLFLLNFVLLHQQVRNSAGINFPISQNFQHLLAHMVPNFNLCFDFSNCHMSILSDELINFFFMSLGRGSSWATITGCSAISVYLSLKGFTHHLSPLACTQASPHA